MTSIKLAITPRSVAVVLAAVVGCDQERTQAVEAPTHQPPQTATKSSSATLDGAKDVLRAYEVIRAPLARDELAAVVASAAALHEAADSASLQAPQTLRAHIAHIASSAVDLGAGGSSPDAVRRAFGETSRHVVALLAAEPTLQNGLHVFKCPMAPGYTKWVQTDAKIANPYMGRSMLECGAGSDWKS